MARAQVSNELVIVQGSTKAPRLEFVDDAGDPEDLSAVDQASVDVREVANDPDTSVLYRSTEDATLTVVDSVTDGSPTSHLELSLTALEADALPPGTYVAQAWLRFGSADAIHASERFRVRVLASAAEKP